MSDSSSAETSGGDETTSPANVSNKKRSKRRRSAAHLAKMRRLLRTGGVRSQGSGASISTASGAVVTTQIESGAGTPMGGARSPGSSASASTASGAVVSTQEETGAGTSLNNEERASTANVSSKETPKRSRSAAYLAKMRRLRRTGGGARSQGSGASASTASGGVVSTQQEIGAGTPMTSMEGSPLQVYGPEAEPLPVLRLQDLPLLRVRLVRLPAHINPLETHIVPPFQLSPPLQEAAPPGPNVPQVSYQDSSSSDSVPHPQDVPTQERNTQQVPHEETSSAEDSSLEEQDLPPEPFNFSDVETLHYPDVAPGPSQESIVQGIADLSARDDSFSGQEAPPAPPDPSDSSDSSLEYPTSESEDDDITQNDIAEAIADQGAPADYGSSEQSSEEDEQVPPQEMTLERHIGHIHVPPVAANTHMAAVRLRNPPAYTLGQYGRVRCPHCGAYKFDVERGRESMSADCCTKGQVSLPMPRIPPAFADTIHNAGWPRFAHFRRNDRIYNNSLAFASTHAEFPHFVGGPHFLTVQGQFYKAAFGGPVPAGDNAPRYNQLYYVETGEANQIRRNRYHDGDGEPLRAGIFDFMTNVLQEVNPFAQGYVSMRERVETERLAARQQGRAEPSEVRLLFRVRGATRQDRPTSYGEIAVVNVGEPQATVTYFCSSRQGGDELRRMRYDEGLSDAMLFPVMFPYGEPGFRQHIPLEFQRGRARHVTPNMFYRYMSAQRDGSDNIHCSNQLLQLYILHGFIKSQAELFYFLRQRTTMGRRDTLEELEGYVRGERGDRVGSAVKLLPSTVVGSPRWYQARLAEAKAITARAGLPTYLLTVTCNPEWKELQENKGPSQKVEDRPDLVAHVFNLFLRQIEYEVRTLQVLGVCVAYLRVTEYQKRGLPHAHALITVRPEDVPRTAAHVDTVISAELPDPELEPELHQVLTRCNFHDRCELNEDAPCLNPGTRTCSKGYPKPYRETTDLYHESGRVEYRRRDDGREYVNAQGVAFRNRNLVPFNAYMSRRFGTHINIEFLNKFEGMFYMYDYIYKGQDHTRYGVGDRPDAINDYVNSRYTGSCEAAARLKGYKLCVSFPQVCRLAVHLERQQQLVHRKGQEAEVVAHPRRTRTSLVAAMELNVRNNVARQVQYEFLLDRFVYNDTTRNFTERATRHPVPLFVVIGRPCRELYALERLLKHMAGPTSYGHLRGRHDSLWARGCALDLFHNETMFGEVTMHALANDETATGQMRRDAFAMLSATYAFEDADAVLRRYSGPLCEGLEKDNFTQMLASCNGIIKTLGGQLVDLDLAIEERAELVREMYNDERYAPSPDAERQAAFREVTRRAQHDLNQEQKDALRAILHAVDDYAEQKRYDQAKCFFVEGPAGCGKTYLYECIILYLKSHGYHHVVCSTSGISAALLPSGETCHKAFGLPTNLHYGSTSQIKVQTDEAEIVRGANIIIADEMGAASKHMLDAMDVLLRDLHNSDVPFGAVPIVCGGDFRQTLPVYQRAHTAACIENGIMRSELWPLFQVHRLTTNMRAAAATFQFRDLLLNVGNGTLPYLTNDSLRVNLPNNIICQGDLISAIFGNPVDLQACADRAILCPKRDHVKLINAEVTERLRGQQHVRLYESCTFYDGLAGRARLPENLLATVSAPNVPPHELHVAVGTLVMLVRNIDSARGLVNGARFQITKLTDHVIYARYLFGFRKETTFAFVRMLATIKDSKLPQIVRRIQFPLRVSYAMTINKAQGQTLGKCGVWLPTPVFGHGQLYVALSRVTRPEDLKVKIGALDDEEYSRTTNNVVEQQALLPVPPQRY